MRGDFGLLVIRPPCMVAECGFRLMGLHGWWPWVVVVSLDFRICMGRGCYCYGFMDVGGGFGFVLPVKEKGRGK